MRDHPYHMHPGPFLGHLPPSNVHLMKDGRLAPSGMEMVSAANHELRVPDVCQSGRA